MRHPARWVALAVAVVVAGLTVVLAAQVGDDPRSEATTSRLLGDPVPAFSLPTLAGSTVSDQSLAGKAVIVNFWNTWCIPCQQEQPALEEFYRRHQNDPDVAMVGIVRDDTRRAVATYVPANGIDWTVAFDPGSRAALAFGTRGQPETFAINPDGKIVATQYGPSSVKNLETILAAARGGAA